MENAKNKCQYIVYWTSAVTKSHRSSGCQDKKTAQKEAAALEREGAKDVRISKFEPAPITWC